MLRADRGVLPSKGGVVQASLAVVSNRHQIILQVALRLKVMIGSHAVPQLTNRVLGSQSLPEVVADIFARTLRITFFVDWFVAR